MLSLILGLIAAAFAMLRNVFHLPLYSILSFLFGLVGWIVAKRILREHPENKSASVGRLIGVISTTTSLMMLGLLIRSFITGGAA